MPWLERWALNGRPVTVADVAQELRYGAATLQALDLADRDRSTPGGAWQAGASATTLLPRATALAYHFRQHATTVA